MIMSEKKISDAQQAAQKRYDEKTKSITIKYTPADMKDFDRMMEYLNKTGKSRSSFIKELINDFFESMNYMVQERKIAKYFSEYVSPEDLERLKQLVNEEQYKIIMDVYREHISGNLRDLYWGYEIAFEDWVDQFTEEIKSGAIDINVSDDALKRVIENSFRSSLGEIGYML